MKFEISLYFCRICERKTQCGYRQETAGLESNMSSSCYLDEQRITLCVVGVTRDDKTARRQLIGSLGREAEMAPIGKREEHVKVQH